MLKYNFRTLHNILTTINRKIYSAFYERRFERQVYYFGSCKENEEKSFCFCC